MDSNMELTPAYEHFIIRCEDERQIQLDNDSINTSIVFSRSDIAGNLCNWNCYINAKPHFEDIDKIVFYRFAHNSSYIMAFYRTQTEKTIKRYITKRNSHPLSDDEIYNILDYYYLSDHKVLSLLEN